MILYFSGTGNSRYAAKLLAEKTGDTMVSINSLIKEGSKGAFASAGKPFVFVCPTYAWRIPRVVEAFIRQASFTGSDQAYFILTCGDDTGNALGYIRRLCQAKGFDLRGFAEIVMPENYIALYKAPQKSLAEKIVQKSTPHILQIGESIRAGEALPAFTPKAKLKSGVVNHAFYAFIVKAKGFYATDACIGCGKCAEACPLNNIAIQGGKPAWGSRCTHCMACISICPTEAIEYKNKTQGKTRYYLEG